MATKIRLKRIGRRNRPFYRMVVMDERSRRDGAAIEELGWYNPLEKDADKLYLLKEDRIFHWLKEGAQTTNTAHNLLRRAGIAYRWHLIKQGLDEKAIEKEMKKWVLGREEIAKSKSTKKAQKTEAIKEQAAEETEPAVEADTEKEEAVAEKDEAAAVVVDEDSKEEKTEAAVEETEPVAEAVAAEEKVDSKDESSEDEAGKESEPEADKSVEEKTAEVEEEPADEEKPEAKESTEEETEQADDKKESSKDETKEDKSE